MPKPSSNYFRYFSPTRGARLWGLALNASGFTRTLPGADYPPVRHPADHQFEWGQGRTLEALQLVLITAGRGCLEVRRGRRRLGPGQAFLLLPGCWHRYRPDPDTGWEESWIEVSGPLVKQLLRAKVFSAQKLIRADGADAGLEVALEAVHGRARVAQTGFDPQLAAAAYQVLAAWERLGHPRAVQVPPLQRAVVAAEHYFSEHLTEEINISAVARQLRVAYSHFRRAFKLHTGYAPWQYVLRLRLAHARRILAARGETTLDEIAERLGFSSGFHLSAAFKQIYGVSPREWRQQVGLGQGKVKGER